MTNIPTVLFRCVCNCSAKAAPVFECKFSIVQRLSEFAFMDLWFVVLGIWRVWLSFGTRSWIHHAFRGLYDSRDKNQVYDGRYAAQGVPYWSQPLAVRRAHAGRSPRADYPHRRSFRTPQENHSEAGWLETHRHFRNAWLREIFTVFLRGCELLFKFIDFGATNHSNGLLFNVADHISLARYRNILFPQRIFHLYQIQVNYRHNVHIVAKRLQIGSTFSHEFWSKVRHMCHRNCSAFLGIVWNEYTTQLQKDNKI